MMYHFVAETTVPHSSCQYLKTFQLEAFKFLESHYAQKEFCVLNDESGLGKSAVTAVFLNNIGKRCLIIVQNDDYITNWKFHLSLLTHLPVNILDGNTRSYEFNYHACVCITKWSTLRSIDDVEMSNNFDIVIIDNRGEMLNNAFCCATLVKQFERKVNIVISSSDITSNVKLLHTILRLGDRLEHQHQNFKVFEQKFGLPNLNDITHKKCNLEEYFAKREMISVYCRSFRLRRYRHQFEHMLPLVDPVAYKNNLTLWKHEQDAASSVLIEDAQQCVVFETETEELLQNFYNEQLAVNKTIAMRHQERPPSPYSDNDDRMSPLIFVSDSETDQHVIIINSPTEVIDLTTEIEKSTHLDLNDTQATENMVENCNVTSISYTPSTSCRSEQEEEIITSNSNLLETQRSCQPSTKINNVTRSPPQKNVKKRISYKKHNSEQIVLKLSDARETRSMKRYTRSNHLKNIYMNVELPLNDSKKRKHKKHKRMAAISNSEKESKQTKTNDSQTKMKTLEAKQTGAKINQEINKRLLLSGISEQCKNISQITIISPSGDYNIECAQRLSNESNFPTTERVFHGSWDEFAVPVIPSNYMINPNSHSTENIANDIITLSSSISNTPSVESCRTRGQRLIRNSSQVVTENNDYKTPNIDLLISAKLSSSNLTIPRRLNQSPDLFSNCSDLEVLCTQDRNMFKAFGVCGVDAKMMQQRNVKRNLAKTQNAHILSRSQSCLDTLEKAFTTQPVEKAKSMTTRSLLPDHPTNLLNTLSQTSSKIGPQNGNNRNDSTSNDANTQPPRKFNRITNYIQINGSTVGTDIMGASCYVATPSKETIVVSKTPTRKSPKSPKMPKMSAQNTKLTRWVCAGSSKQPIRRRRLELV